jgi:hypothetical protein
MAVVAVVWWSRAAVQDSAVAVRSSGSSNTNLVVAAATLNSNSKQWADKRQQAWAWVVTGGGARWSLDKVKRMDSGEQGLSGASERRVA